MIKKISTRELIERLEIFWERKNKFKKVEKEINHLTLLTSPYFRNTFTPSIGAGILDFKIAKILSNPTWDIDYAGDKFYVNGLNFRAFDVSSVAYGDDRLSLFHSIACFSVNNPNNKIMTQEELINKTYDFLVGQIGLSPEKIIVSIFSGGKIDNIYYQSDEKSIKTWLKLGIKENNIIQTSIRFNFLASMVEQYRNHDLLPFVGPRSEIFYYIKDSHPKLIEIATMQFIVGQRDKDNIQKILKIPEVSSIAFGIERLMMILNSVNNIYEIDILKPVLDKAYELVNEKIKGPYFITKELIKPEIQTLIDHIRAYYFIMFHIDKNYDAKILTDGRKSTINRLKKGINQSAKALGINIQENLKEIVDMIINTHISIQPEIKNYGVENLELIN